MAAVVVAHNSEEHLGAILASLHGQLRAGDELVVVDNASLDATRDIAGEFPRVRLIKCSRNAGYGIGCHLGADVTTAPLLLFLNPDCRIEPGSLEALRSAASRHPEWASWQPMVLLPDGRINSSGGIVHYTGVGWAGDFGRQPDELMGGDRTTTFPCGAAMVVRREAWDLIGGFEPEYFLYCEDLDLGLRLWLTGREVGVVADAYVTHDYDFERTRQKRFWLERNRLLTVLAVYPGRLLVLLLPAMLAAEMVIMLEAARQGWLGAKLRAQMATLTALPRVARRRRRIQALRRCETAQFAALLVSHLDSPFLETRHGTWIDLAQATLWSAVRTLLDSREPARATPPGDQAGPGGTSQQPLSPSGGR